MKEKIPSQVLRSLDPPYPTPRPDPDDAPRPAPNPPAEPHVPPVDPTPFRARDL